MAPFASPRRRGLALLAGALLLGGAVALLRSPSLRVGAVTLQGAQHLSAREYQAIAGVQSGDFIWNASAGGIAQRLQSEAWVKSAQVQRQGNNLAINLTERQPVALYPYGQGFFLVLDDEGVILGLQQLSDGLLPVVSGSQVTGALRGGKVSDAGVRDALLLLGWMAPELRKQVSQVAVESERRLTLYLTDGATVRWGRLPEGETAAKEVEQKLSELGGYWQKMDKVKARGCIIDMRVADRLISSGCE
jgi:cell division septal protein FtsQ